MAPELVTERSDTYILYMSKTQNTHFTYDSNIVSDLHKDAFGFRPSDGFWADWRDFTPVQKQAEWDYLCEAANQAVREDQQREDEEYVIADFDHAISDYIAVGAADAGVAIRWMLDAMDLDEYDLMYGGSYICHRLGLPYSMAPTFEPFCKQMLADMDGVE